MLGGIGVLISTATMGIGNFAETMPQQLINILLYLPRYLVWGSMLLGALLTVISAWLIERKGFDNHIRLTLRFRPLTARGAVSALSAMLLLGFWLENSGRFVVDDGVIAEMYPRVLRITPELIAVGVLLAVLCLGLALIRTEIKETGK